MPLRPAIHRLARHRTLAFALAALALAALLFGPHLEGEYLWDDIYLVQQNPLVSAPDGWRDLLARDLWGGATGRPTQLWHPIPMLSFWLQEQAGAGGVTAFRTLNVLCHLAAAILLFSWLQRLSVGVRAAAAAALVFLVHPSTTEPVMWLTGRHDLLGVALLLAGLHFWPLPSDRRPWLRAAAASTVSALAFACKEPFLVGPALLLAYEALLARGSRSLGESLARAALAIAPVAGLVSIRLALGISLGSEQTGAALDEHAVHYASLTLHYGAQILSLGNGPTVEKYAELSAAPAAAVLAALALALGALAWAWRRGYRGAAGALFGIGAAHLVLLPYVLAVPVLGLWANRYAYLPLALWCVALAFGAEVALSRLAGRARALFWVGAGALVAAGAALTSQEVRPWRTGLDLFGTALRARPDDPQALYHYGFEVLARRGCSQALPLFERASTADPRFWRAVHNVAGCRVNLRQWDQAEPAARAAVRLAPQNGRSRYNLAVVLASTSRLAQARTELRKALDLEPGYAPAAKLLTEIEAFLAGR
jgi:tetratricopeptide (TPR) repeat protein